MPLNGKAGWSRYTRVKEMHFRTLLRGHLSIVNAVIERNPLLAHNAYVYIDMNAGPGFYPEIKTFGSPLIFLDEIQNAFLDFEAYFIDKDPDAVGHLRSTIREEAHERLFPLHRRYGWTVDHRVQIRRENNEDATLSIVRGLNDLAKHCFGLIYSDPNGDTPFDTIANVTKDPRSRRLDVLLHLSATAIKRLRLSGCMADTRDLEERLEAVSKRFWLVREPWGAHQWTFLLGTNWEGMKGYRKIGLHRIDKPEGRKALQKLNLTEEERRDERNQVDQPEGAPVQTTFSWAV